jgi:hypothetical protein
MATCGRASAQLCRQEVTGSIPVGSTTGSPCKSGIAVMSGCLRRSVGGLGLKGTSRCLLPLRIAIGVRVSERAMNIELSGVALAGRFRPSRGVYQCGMELIPVRGVRAFPLVGEAVPTQARGRDRCAATCSAAADAVVCRCEAVSMAWVRWAVRAGVRGIQTWSCTRGSQQAQTCGPCLRDPPTRGNLVR